MGLKTCVSLINKCNFPWLFSNVIDPETKKQFLPVQEKVVVNIDNVKVKF